VTILETLAEKLAGLGSNRLAPDCRESLDIHIMDTVCACLAGSMTPDGQAVRNFTSRSTMTTSPLDDVTAAVAMTRLSEIDDIHLASGTTPGSIIVPTAIVLAKHLGIDDAPRFAAAVTAGYEAMTRLGAAARGHGLVYKGVWTTYFTAPFGAAAVCARLLELAPGKTAHALAIALSMLAGRAGTAGADKTSRWLLAGSAARTGCTAALFAEDGFTGDTGLLDGDWFETAQGLEIDREAFLPGREATVLPEISIKPYCSAKQMIAAIAGFEDLLAGGIDPDEIEAVTVSVPESYARMIDHGTQPGNRLSSLTSAPYQLALAAYHRDGLFDVAREQFVESDAITALMGKVSVEVDGELARHLPDNWPGRVSIDAGGQRHSVTVVDAPGDPKAAFERTQAMEKFHHFTENLIGPDDAGDWIEMALAASSDDAQLARLQDRFLGLVPNP